MKNEMSIMVSHSIPSYMKEVLPPGTEIKAGDTKIMWDPANADEVESAKATFDKLIGRGFVAFRAEGKEGTKGAKLTSFDASVGRMIMIPKIQGGCGETR